jgi:hypothetical protein
MRTITEYTESVKAAYDAQAPVKEPVRLEVPAEKLAAGDLHYLSGSVIESKRTGNTKVIVKVKDKKTELRFDPKEMLSVERAVETDESKESRAALYAEVRAASILAGLVAEPSRAKLDEYLEQSWMEQVAAYAVDLAAAQTVTGYCRPYAEAVAAGKLTAVEAAEELRQKLAERVMCDFDSPSYSGGFSSGNAVRQAVQAACRKAWSMLERGW